MTSLHEQRRDHDYDPSCFGCKAGSLRFGVSAEVKAIDGREVTLRKDLDAYRRLRMEGHQPERIGGSAYLETNARNKWEIEHPRLMALPDDAREHVPEAMQVVSGINPALSAHKDTA